MSIPGQEELFQYHLGRAAMKNAAELNQLVEEMRIKGSGGKQEIRAEDDSSISGVKQIIE